MSGGFGCALYVCVCVAGVEGDGHYEGHVKQNLFLADRLSVKA